MADIRLFINNKEADLNGAESAIAITYRFSDLSAPDQITDTYSKTLTLPGTKNNNAIFAQGWHLQSMMVPTFNASLRNTFKLTVDSNELYSGYIKLNKVTLNNKVYSYDVTLYGEITSYMNALAEMSFIEGIRYMFPQGISHLLTTSYVSESWNDGTKSANPIIYVPCNNGQYDDFDTGKELQYDNGKYSIASSKYWVDSNSYEFESNEWQRSEFRVTKQRPAMKVMNMMNSICHTHLDDVSTGISSVDGDFSGAFYSANPYCQKSVMTFPLIEFPEDVTIEDSGTVEGSFAKVHNNQRYNTIALHVANNDPDASTYRNVIQAHEPLAAAPYGEGQYKTFNIDMTPAVDIAGIFNGSDTADLSQYALLLDDSSVYGCTFRIEYLMGLRVDPLSNRNWIFAGYNGGPTGSNGTPINFMSYTEDTYGQSGSGMVKVLPQLVVTWDNTEHVYAMNPYFDAKSFTNNSTTWGKKIVTSSSNGMTMIGHDIFTKYGAQCGTNYWMSPTGDTYSQNNVFSLFPDVTNSYLLGYTGSTGVPTDTDVPWQYFNDGYYVNEKVIDLENPDRRFTVSSEKHRHIKYPYRPHQWRYHLSLSGEMLKTASFKIRFVVYKPQYICIPASGSTGINNARNRINALVDPADRLSEVGLYNISYDMDVLITSMTRTALPVPSNGNSGSQSVTYYQNNGTTTANVHNLATADFKVKDITIDGLMLSDGYLVTDDMILDSETTCKDILTSFTKIFGLIYDEHDAIVRLSDNELTRLKRIKICTRNEYFNNYKILDWSDKVDWSQSVDIEPVVMSTKWLSMKFNSSDTYYEKKYDNKYGFEYGQARINTGYQFNTDTEELMKDTLFNNTVVSSEFNWFYDYNASRQYIRESVNLPPCPAYFDKDNGEYKSVDTKFNFLFDNGLLTGNNTGSGGGSYGGRYVITQDSSLMFSLGGGGKACWYGPSTMSVTHSPGMIVRAQYRYYSTFMDSDPYYGAPYSWDFSKPQENYQGITDAMYPENCTIYGRYWRRYIEEIYNVKNKKVTMYLYLTPEDMASFSFKNFVAIDGVLFHVNQITDYSPAAIRPVQVELITVQDILAYTDGQDIRGQPSDTNEQAYQRSKTRSSMKNTQDSTL